MEPYFKSNRHIENAKNASILGNIKLQELKNERIDEYNLNPKKCLNCNNPIPYDKKNENKFCNKSCSAIFNNKFKDKVVDNTKLKISKSLILYFEKNPNKVRRKINLSVNEIGDITRYCELCGKNFEVKRLKNGRLSAQKYCSEECSKIGMKLNVSKSQKERVKNGIHMGWQSRKILSYPEKFFIKVLDNNNLDYKHNFIINKRDLGLNDVSNYFLDFYFENKKIDLEIDGKQHNYEERKESDEYRDSILTNFGIQVYRIKWKNIQTNEGNEYIKNEIDKFLSFISK